MENSVFVLFQNFRSYILALQRDIPVASSTMSFTSASPLGSLSRYVILESLVFLHVGFHPLIGSVKVEA